MTLADIQRRVGVTAATTSGGGFPASSCGAIDSPPNIRGGPFSGGYSTGAARYLRVDKSYYPGGSMTAMEGRIWDGTWKTLTYGSPDGFLPAVSA